MNHLLPSLPLISISAFAQQEGKRVYQKDSLGNNLYHKQSWVIKDGKHCPVDTVGSRQHNKPCLDIGSKEMEKAKEAAYENKAARQNVKDTEASDKLKKIDSKR